MDKDASAEQSPAAAEPAVTNRREHPRILGPFDARRVGMLETPLRIYNLSQGGCFIASFHDEPPGVQFTLRIDLPPEGWITVKAETLNRSNEFGFAVRFVEVDAVAGKRLERALTALEKHEPFRRE